MKKIIISISIFAALILFIFTGFAMKANSVFVNDNLLDICNQPTEYENGINSYIAEPSKHDYYYGIYKLEYCALSQHRDNATYLVKLRDAKTNKVYKRAITKGAVEIRDLWGWRDVITNVGEESVCFKLPPDNDPRKEELEKNLESRFNSYDTQNCI